MPNRSKPKFLLTATYGGFFLGEQDHRVWSALPKGEGSLDWSVRCNQTKKKITRRVLLTTPEEALDTFLALQDLKMPGLTLAMDKV